MIDADLDYCSLQIEHQEDKIKPLLAALNSTKDNIRNLGQEIAEQQKELARLKHMRKELESKFSNEKRILGEMVKHRKQLKAQKKFLNYQHRTIKDNQ